MLSPLKENYGKPRHYIEKQQHHFAGEGLHRQSCSFPVVMFRCEIWTIKKTECLRTDACEMLSRDDS